MRGDRVVMLEQLASQYDRLRLFMDSMEQMRWRLTSALGVGAITSLAATVAAEKLNATAENYMILGAIAVAVIAVAGIVTQLRIIDLFWDTWSRMIVVQKWQREVLLADSDEVPPNLREALLIPPIVSPFAENPRFLSVHSANCLVFSTFLGIAVALLWEPAGGKESCATVAGIGAGIGLLAYAVSRGGDRHVKEPGEPRTELK